MEKFIKVFTGVMFEFVHVQICFSGISIDLYLRMKESAVLAANIDWVCKLAVLELNFQLGK